MHIIQNALRRAAGQHLRANEIDQRGLRFANVFDDLLIDPRTNFLLNQSVVDLTPIQLVVEYVRFGGWNFIDDALDVAPFLLLIPYGLVLFVIVLLSSTRIVGIRSS